MHIFRHRHFCSNNVYYSVFDTVVYMYCPPMMPCGVGSYGLDDNGWNTTSFSSLYFEGVTVTFLIQLKYFQRGRKTCRLLGLITSTFLTILCAVIWILTLSCWDTCVQFLLTHMYINMCTHVQYTSNLLLWLLLLFLFSALCFNSCPDFLVDRLCCRSLKGKVTWFFTPGVVSGVCGHFNEDIF